MIATQGPFAPKAPRQFFSQNFGTKMTLKKCRFFITFLTTAFTFSALDEIFEKWNGGIHTWSSASGIAILFGAQEGAEESILGARPAG